VTLQAPPALLANASLPQLAAIRITGELAQARQLFAALERHAQALGVTLRRTPPEPDTCCGRGCNGCVWEGFYAATEFWRQDAIEACEHAATAASSGIICPKPSAHASR
jgi:hypothetical protein